MCVRCPFFLSDLKLDVEFGLTDLKPERPLEALYATQRVYKTFTATGRASLRDSVTGSRG